MVAGSIEDALVETGGTGVVDQVLAPVVPDVSELVRTAAVAHGRRGRSAMVAAARLGASAGALLACAAAVALGVAPVATAALLVGWVLLASREPSAPVAGRAARAARSVRSVVVLGWVCWSVGAFVALPATPDHLVLTVAGLGLGTFLGTEVGLGAHRLAGGDQVRRVVLVGRSHQVASALEVVGTDPGTDVAAVCLLDGTDGADGSDAPAGAASERLREAAREAGAEAVVVLPDGSGPRELQRLGWAAEQLGLDLLVSASGLGGVAPARTALVPGGGLGLVRVRPARRTGVTAVVKAVWERAAAVLALAVLAPVLLAVGLWVRRDSAGPAIFRQQRVGRDGRLFTIWKFRTMGVGADARLAELRAADQGHGLLFKLHRDPRVTRVGAVLRRFSIDELPQLVNVALGQMSLVGPRPALPSEVAQYDHDPRRRLAVKPGLTGLWQVSGRSDLDWEQSVHLDLAYVDNWSLHLDAQILARTVGAVLRPRGAY